MAVQAVQIERYRFTTADYHRLAEAGILGEDERVELIEGEIIRMNPIGPRHSGDVNRLTRLFIRALGDDAVVHIQNPIWLDEHSEPQPDLALLRPRRDFYAAAHPTPADVLLVIEVADSSVAYDRRVKAPLYARSGILEYWLLNLEGEHVVVYRDPTATGYRSRRLVRRGGVVSPVAFPRIEIAVGDLFG
jgi:Uma2 family endonuclease